MKYFIWKFVLKVYNYIILFNIYLKKRETFNIIKQISLIGSDGKFGFEEIQWWVDCKRF